MAAVLYTTSGCAANCAHYMLTGRTFFRWPGDIVLCDGKAGISMEVKNCRFGSATMRIKLSLVTPLLAAAAALVAVAATPVAGAASGA